MIKNNPSKRLITRPNGTTAYVRSADNPDRLRGPQCHWFIADELASWRAWDMLMFGFRLGDHPQGSVPAYVRESYSKKTHVAPQDVTIERFLEIAEIAFVEGSSVTKSVDDACLHAAEFNGNPEQPCSVIFWDIKSDERGDYRRFVDDYYGNIDIEFMPPEEPEEPEEPEALVLTYPTTHMPPVITQQFGPTHGGIDLRSSWRVWGDELVAALDSVVVLVGDSDIFGHQILTRSTFNGQTIEIRYAHLIQDSAYVAVGQHLSRGDLIGKPGNTGLSTGDHLHFSVKIGSEYVDPEPLIDFPDETTPPVEPPVDPPVDPEPPTFERWTNNYVGLHMQFMASSTWDEYVSQGHPSVMKSFSCGDAVTIGRLADPRTLNIWRHYEPDPGGMLRNADGSFKNDADMRASAQRWLDYYSTELNTVSNNWNIPIPELLADIDVLTSLNEVMAAGNPEIVPAVTFDVMFAEEIDKRFGGLVKGGLLNVAVGNPAENEVQYLLPVAKICHEKNHFIGYHCYWTGGHEPHGNYVLGADVDGEYRELWPHLAGRWQAWDDVFTSSGYYPQYYGGETGTVYVPPEWKPWELHHGDGWKAAGSFEWYIQLIDTFNAQMLAWNATHGNRHRGAVLFTYPAWGWDSWTWNDGDTLLLRDWAVNLTANDN